MSSGPTQSMGAVSRALYRSLLRTAVRMPDDHRRALVVFRTRSEFDKSRSLTSLEAIQERQLEGEIYKDQLDFQAEHLQSLAQSSNLLFPVDIRSVSATLEAHVEDDRRKLVRAIESRKQGAVRGRSGRNRFMEGPEPSWIAKAKGTQR
ncbi:hypothetical protein JCM3766R1_001557 [Sporobolomyces carnicolor]